MTTWTQQLDDLFGRADTSAGTAGSTTGVGNGWIDAAGGTWRLSGGKLVGSTTDTGGYTSRFLRRPSSEAAVNQRIVARLTAPFVGNMAVGLRCQTSGDYYLFDAGDTYPNSPPVFLYRIAGGAVTSLGNANLSGAIVSGHQITLDASATGTNPTTLTLTLTDTTAGTTLATLTATDSGSTLQAAGVAELVQWVTDSSRSPATASYAQVTMYQGDTAPSLGPLNVGAIGDSITAGTNGDSVGALASYLSGQGYAVTATNRGVSGSSTTDWLPGGSLLGPAIAAFQAAGTTLVQIMLGTNDYRTPNSLTPAQHAANMRAIVRTVRAAGMQVVLHHPPYTVPGAAFNGVVWPADINDRYRQGWALDMALVDGVGVMVGDTGVFQMATLAPGTFLHSDGVHPADATQNTLLGQYWAIALMQRGAKVQALTYPGGAHP